LARRVSLPAADDLFRPTVVPDEPGASEPREGAAPGDAPGDAPGGAAPEESSGGTTAARTPSGRVRHDEKMTVYVTAEELLDLEHARLTLRRDHGLAVDRGRLVREALAVALADLDANGEDSVVVQRLTGP
jgi:hypothetical protein